MCKALSRSVATGCTAAALLLAAMAVGAAEAPAAERLPDLDQEAPSQLDVMAVGSGKRTEYRLGFSSAVRNIGDGPLVIDGHRESTAAPQMVADQLVDQDDGAPSARVPGVGVLSFVSSPDHRHWHLHSFDRYELRRAGAGAGRAIVRDRKSGFCLGDRYRVTTPVRAAAAPQPVYTSRCGLDDTELLTIREGISVGYGDNYRAHLEYQDLPLTGLRNGRYVLVHRTNSDRRIRETNLANDAASELLDLRWRGGRPYLRILRICPDSARCDRPAAARPRATATAAGPFMPNDPGDAGRPGGWAQEQWNFTGAFGVHAPEAWGNLLAAGAPGGKGVTVAVLDTGVAYSNRPPHRRSPDLAFRCFLRGYDFVDDDPYPVDEEGHGTHVASTIAEATNNDRGLTGLAYGARILPVRVLDRSGSGDPRVIARGVRYAVRRGAKIINLSLSFDARVTASQIGELMRAIDAAHRRGVLVVGAAGNAGVGVIAEPARSGQMLAVGATTENGCLASFSNRGPGIDLVAPGGGDDAALSGDLACSAGRLGRAIFQMTLDRPGANSFGVPRDYMGTSMATAHVSAIAALVVASGVLGPNPSPDAISQRLELTARDLGQPGYDTRYGAGLVDAAAATGPAAPQPAEPVADASSIAARSSRSSASQ